MKPLCTPDLPESEVYAFSRALASTERNRPPSFLGSILMQTSASRSGELVIRALRQHAARHRDPGHQPGADLQLSCSEARPPASCVERGQPCPRGDSGKSRENRATQMVPLLCVTKIKNRKMDNYKKPVISAPASGCTTRRWPPRFQGFAQGREEVHPNPSPGAGTFMFRAWTFRASPVSRDCCTWGAPHAGATSTSCRWRRRQEQPFQR